MSIYGIYWKDYDGETTDKDRFCSITCLKDALRVAVSMLSLQAGNLFEVFVVPPERQETEDDAHCAKCRELLWKGIETEV